MSNLSYAISPDVLRQRQSLPMEAKVVLSQLRIREWNDRFGGKVYVSFSGGKDSTVLLHIARQLYPKIPAVFIDTGLEFPEIRDFVKTIDNVIWIKPKIPFPQVISKYGYPIISKEQASFIQEYRDSKSRKLQGIRINGNKSGKGKISRKWNYLLDSDFLISDKCCDVMKKEPAHRYEKETGNAPIIGVMADEGSKRVQDYLRFGCNAFDAKRPISRPMGFWLEEDVWAYIKKYNIPYSSIYDKGYTRTGCMFCMFGIHLEKEPNRFQRLYETHPAQWNYCINTLGCGRVLDTIKVPYTPKPQEIRSDMLLGDLTLKGE